MSLFTQPPGNTDYTIKQGDNSLAVWALQHALNSIPVLGLKLAEDGDFGPGTKSGVVKYQREVELTTDGIVGPATQRRLAVTLRYDADPDMTLPRGLVDSLVSGESGGLIAAVNWSIPGGVDCGYTQRRVYTPFTEAAVRRGFDAPYQFKLLSDQLLSRFKNFVGYSYVKSRSDAHEFAWRLAALEHNWPYGASVLAKGGRLSSRSASWVPQGCKFEDGAPVVTYADWAKFYAMGSHMHHHHGLVVKQAFGIPIDG